MLKWPDVGCSIYHAVQLPDKVDGHREWYVPNDFFVESIHFREKTNYSQNAVFIFGNFSNNFNSSRIYYNNSWFNGSIAHLRNVIVTNASSPMDHNTLYLFAYKFRFDFIWGIPKGKITHEYKSAICLGHSAVQNYYGHFFFDMLNPLILFPQEIVNKSVILNVPKYSHGDSGILLKAIGIQDWQIKYCDGDFSFVHDYYCCYAPVPGIWHLSTTIQNVSISLKKFYNTSDVKPSKYVLSNRKKTRYIYNFDQLVKSVKKHLPEFSWEVVEDGLSVEESAKVYSTILFMYTITGSNLCRLYFMNPGGCVVDAQADYNDFAMQSIALVNGFKIVCYRLKDFYHDKINKKQTRVNVNITEALYYIDFGLAKMKE
ncbi:hypothetical protein TVAG_118280 [Trichomonas vaginalis G3]|uniref:Glycosyltransferase 61 catalytic domain-containing protein n=1 Tax=Trichomonas vaginalis (strain ATCC PRA-98 / G3) TaxID=412133 RepID=A2EI15_TRIV3|nr:glycosyltransferase family [Trichomonas vaginalis G3]EAY07747.1 hypothetical protein TVAG_118280 [Trichomonas vaginalis G3]KAI5552594.1 glycosyltransferase family [Trichomonas vaginalis G3]|eukprot:XP_001319970.1 hypothetical protein [Trichomonas vaginalis G3]